MQILHPVVPARLFGGQAFFARGGSSGRLRAGSLPGQANFNRLVLTNETFRPSFSKRRASALISGSVSVKYSFLLRRIADLDDWRPYW